MVARDEKIDAWMPLYVRDLLSSTADLGAAKFGAYTRLLCHLWLEHGYLADDQERLRKLARVPRAAWPGTWNVLARFFDLSEGRISQRRLLQEREQALELRRARSRGGKSGAAARWGTDALQDGSAMAESSTHLTITSPSPEPRSEPEVCAVPAERAAAPPAEEQGLMTFATVRGKRTGTTEWRFTEVAAATLREGFPDLDVLAEARKARAWLLANPGHRKTADGMMSFLFRWLARAQNRGGARTGSTPAAPSRPASPGLCSFHERAESANRAARRHDPECSECRHVAAKNRRTPGGSSEPTPVAALVGAEREGIV